MYFLIDIKKWYLACEIELRWVPQNPIDKNIERHIAHTIVSRPNPKQWVIVHTSDLIMIIRQSMYILSIFTKEKGKLVTHSPTYCIMDNSENIIIIIVIIIIIIIMSVFYSANFNSDKSPCSKALMISDRHQTEPEKNTQYDRNVTSQLWICDIKQMCLQIALENVNGLGTLDGDGERVPERTGGMRKTTLAKTFQAIMLISW